jgi:very-short-patch-repair endonuclease
MGAASEAELRLHSLIRAAGLTGWSTNVRIRDGAGRVIAVVDIIFATQRVVIEVDGYRAHSGRAAFVNDRRRQNALVNAGYRVLRVTWDDLRDRPAEVIAEIRLALRMPRSAA